jgi:hypothetical protein
MADVSPQSPQPNQPPASPNQKNPPKLGSFVERLRSYETDIARLKGEPLQPVVPEKKVPPPPPPFVPPPEPKPDLEIAGKPAPYIQVNGNTAQAVKAANTIVSDVKKEDPKKAVEALHKDTPVHSMRTIQTDAAQSVKENKNPIDDVIAAAAKQRPKRTVIEDPKRSFYLLGLSGLLIIVGLITFGVFYLVKNAPKTPPAIVINPETVIPTEGKKELSLDPNQSLVSLLAVQERQAPGTPSEIVRFVIREGTSSAPIDGQRFATLLSNRIPDWLVRSFNPTYMTGLYNASNGWQPIIIFKIDSYENAYAGMLKWEETMSDDLKVIINQKTASTTSTALNPITNTLFKDAVIKNKDVRVLEDKSGRRIMLYSFVDPQTLVITTDQATLEEVFARLTTSKFVR